VADFLLLLPMLLFSVVAHEYAHAWMAYREGDTTAHDLGRLTLNPIPHIDPIMSVIVPVLLWKLSGGTFTFGAAKPVPINPRNFRHYRRGDILVSSAGIVMNLILAVIAALLFAGVGLLADVAPALSGTLEILQQMMGMGIMLNVFLAFFNLMPIPPLDGSHILYHALPPALGEQYRRLGRYGFLVLMLTFAIPGLWSRLLWPVGFVGRFAMSALGGYAIP
jgi:Zn-dependent protease